MIRAHKIRLDPTNKQKNYFARAAGCARFASNWALAEWQRQYEAGGNPSEASLRRDFNAIKAKEWPWIYEVTKCAPQMAIKDLGKAFQNFFAKRAAYPKFKKKGVHDSFTLSNDHFRIKSKTIHIPHLGLVRLREPLRLSGKPLWATISREADQWYVSISVEQEDVEVVHLSLLSVGVDLGVKNLASLSNGEVIANPNALERHLKKLKRLSKALSRKKPASKNRRKAKQKLSRLHLKIKNVRNDALHKFTTELTTKYAYIAMEDLNVSGMIKNTRLARRISDSSFHEIKRQIVYKASAKGVRLGFVPLFFPSSKTCSHCQAVYRELSLSERVWTCKDCGTSHDRDINAAKNILDHAVSYTVAGKSRQACGEGSSGAKTRKRSSVKRPSTKQESSTTSAYE